MSDVISGNIPATQDDTVVDFSVTSNEQKVAELEVRLASLEEDFSKLTAFVNSINDRLTK